MTNVLIIGYSETDTFKTYEEKREIIAVQAHPDKDYEILGIYGYDVTDDIQGYFEYSVFEEDIGDESPVKQSIKVIENLFNELNQDYSEFYIDLDPDELRSIQKTIDEDLFVKEQPVDLLTAGLNSNTWLNSIYDEFYEDSSQEKTVFEQLAELLKTDEGEVRLIDWLESEYQIQLQSSALAKQTVSEATSKVLSEELGQRDDVVAMIFDRDDIESLLRSARIKVTPSNIKKMSSELRFFLKGEFNNSAVREWINYSMVSLINRTSLKNIFN